MTLNRRALLGAAALSSLGLPALATTLRESSLLFPPPEHLAHRLFDGLARVIQQQGVFGGLQRRDRAGRIPVVTSLEVCAKSRECSGNAL